MPSLTECIIFDVSVMVWSAAEKYTLVAAKLYGDWYPDSHIFSYSISVLAYKD